MLILYALIVGTMAFAHPVTCMSFALFIATIFCMARVINGSGNSITFLCAARPTSTSAGVAYMLVAHTVGTLGGWMLIALGTGVHKDAYGT